METKNVLFWRTHQPIVQLTQIWDNFHAEGFLILSKKFQTKKIRSLSKKSKRCIRDLFWIQFFRNLFNRDIQSFDESKRKRKGLSKTRTMNKSARDSGSQAFHCNSNWRHKVLDKDLGLRTISLSANVPLAECSHLAIIFHVTWQSCLPAWHNWNTFSFSCGSLGSK